MNENKDEQAISMAQNKGGSAGVPEDIHDAPCKPNYNDEANDLYDTYEEMNELLERAKGILRGTGIHETRAKMYWLAHIDQALNKDDWFSMISTCKDLEYGEEY